MSQSPLFHPRPQRGLTLPRHGRRTHGLTLIELLVTVAVVGVLLAVGVPGMGSFMAKRAAASYADQFATDMRFTRSEALKRGVPTTLCAAAANNPQACSDAVGDTGMVNGWLVFADRNGNGTVDDNDTVLRVQQSVADRLASATSTRGYVFTFLTMGMMVQQNAIFTFTPKGSSGSQNQKVMCINRTGRTSSSSCANND